MNSKNKIVTFSATERAKQLQSLSTEEYDLLVIGGGVTGCGIALDAASRGMKVGLIEKVDFAAGTSSKSTELIHGGLRYLKQFEVGLVRETGRERAIVHKLAPHLVLPEKMLLPIIKKGTYGKWAAWFGVLVYDLLAGVGGDDRRKMLDKKTTFGIEPLLDESILKGGCLYAEYRTDDARLTIELIKRATCYGAMAVNYCTATDFEYDNDRKVKGVTCSDEINGKIFTIQAKQIVSAGGPWVDKLRAINSSKNGKQLHLTKGVHIVFPHHKLPLKHSVYFDVPDGRMIFAIPRGKVTYVGTTDTNYTGNLDRVVATKADATYLLEAVRHAFPSTLLEQTDVISNWSGLRPLIHEEGKSPSELSRKDEIFESPSGLISIAGGKLTGYRRMAERIVDLVDERLEKPYGSCFTDKITLVPDALKNSQAVKEYIRKIKTRVSRDGLVDYHSWYLVTTYGKQTEVILDKMETFSDAGEIALTRAELWYGVQYEMVNSFEDFYVRRTGRLYFDINSIAETREAVTKDMMKYLNWDKERLVLENKKLDALIYDATHYYEAEY
ncbi:MAG: glycerol kinase [Patescibacteria group bacterium]|jgi:glycerol kinase